jgi:ABC-type Na+ efflux pump permease subunit
MLIFALFLFLIGMLGIGCFYVLAIIHIRKFKEYSHLITPATRILGVLLLLILVFGSIAILRSPSQSPSQKNIATDEDNINY